MNSKNLFRLFFAVVVAVSGIVVAVGYVQGYSSRAAATGTGDGTASLDERGPITVVATDSNSWLGERSEGPRALAELVAFAQDGSVVYYNDSHTRYWDVDPVPGTRATVEYGYADHLNGSECPADWDIAKRGVSQADWDRHLAAWSDVDACTRNGFERVNLTTGEVTHVWSRITPGKPGTRYHDVDRINETHLVVADIYLDRVYTVNIESDQTEWVWNASDALPTDRGGPYPKDWSHINDVEVLDDGRFMVSARNHDQVLFLDSDGVMPEWTLGEDDNRSILSEQHNPDYIPASMGGPAVLVADSENNRVVEYQRVDGEWRQSWTWQDSRMQWPRDADRLPDGHTLVTDSNGNRVFEVDENGDVVWSVDVSFPYEAERLGTGDESAGGPSANRRLESVEQGGFWVGVKGLLPGKYLNAVVYVLPPWMTLQELFALVAFVAFGVLWLGAEARWAYRR
jgi:hypothetical protein